MPRNSFMIFILLSFLAVIAGAASTAAADTLFAMKDLPNGRKAGEFFTAESSEPLEGAVRISEEELKLLQANKSTLLKAEILTTADHRHARAAAMIHAPLTMIHKVLFDFDSYLRLYKELHECRVLKSMEEGKYLVAYQVFESWPKKKFYTHWVERTPNGMTWRLATEQDIAPFTAETAFADYQTAVKRSLDDFRTNEGNWQFIPVADQPGALLGIYTISMRLQGAVMGSSLASKILDSLSRDNLPNVLNIVKRESEKQNQGGGSANNQEKASGKES